MAKRPAQGRDLTGRLCFWGGSTVGARPRLSGLSPPERLRPRVVSLALPFQLAEVPKTAKLEMIVSPLETACPLARQPQASTRISVNNQSVTKFTLGPDRLGQTHRVSAAIDVRLLRAGENVLQVSGAPCTLGNFEVVRFNGIALTVPQ